MQETGSVAMPEPVAQVAHSTKKEENQKYEPSEEEMELAKVSHIQNVIPRCKVSL